MEPESQTPLEINPPPEPLPLALSSTGQRDFARDFDAGFEPYTLPWLLFGPQGLRAGVSVLLAYGLLYLMRRVVAIAFSIVHLLPAKEELTPSRFLIGESMAVLAMLLSWAIVAFIERRRILDYNLRGPRRPRHFFSGLATGFAALSALVGLLAMGGWLRFGPVALSGAAIFHYALVWGCMFLLVGCFEEGMFRCYLQFTLTRGIDFRWALTAVAVMCGELIWRVHGIGVWGVYAAALIGLVPCFYLHKRPTPHSAFWQAAWVTSTAFGFLHTSNNGENWIGIFAAAAIGFIFCVSIRLTGSAWWAIGCHAAWDWAETYFYGAADSGITAPGHYLTSMPAGRTLWSGGTDGPEGSLLILVVLVLLLAWLLLVYGRKAASVAGSAAAADLSA